MIQFKYGNLISLLFIEIWFTLNSFFVACSPQNKNDIWCSDFFSSVTVQIMEENKMKYRFGSCSTMHEWAFKPFRIIINGKCYVYALLCSLFIVIGILIAMPLCAFDTLNQLKINANFSNTSGISIQLNYFYHGFLFCICVWSIVKLTIRFSVQFHLNLFYCCCFFSISIFWSLK